VLCFYLRRLRFGLGFAFSRPVRLAQASISFQFQSFPAPTIATGSGKTLNDRNVANRVLNKVIRETGLPHFTFHDLRRTHATMLVAAGIDPKVVQQRMGHESIETTLKYYAQPTKERRGVVRRC